MYFLYTIYNYLSFTQTKFEESEMMKTILTPLFFRDFQDASSVSADDEKLEIEFNYELLDDSYTIFNKSGGKSSSFFLDNVLSPDATEYPSYDWHSMYLYDDTNEGLVPEAQPYHESSSLMKYYTPSLESILV